METFLIEISAAILKFKDKDRSHLMEKICGSTGQKGTGKWMAISALEYGMPVTHNLIGESVFACGAVMSNEKHILSLQSFQNPCQASWPPSRPGSSVKQQGHLSAATINQVYQST